MINHELQIYHAIHRQQLSNARNSPKFFQEPLKGHLPPSLRFKIYKSINPLPIKSRISTKLPPSPRLAIMIHLLLPPRHSQGLTKGVHQQTVLAYLRSYCWWKKILHLLIWVNLASFTGFYTFPGGCLGFLNRQQYLQWFGGGFAMFQSFSVQFLFSKTMGSPIQQKSYHVIYSWHLKRKH